MAMRKTPVHTERDVNRPSLHPEAIAAQPSGDRSRPSAHASYPVYYRQMASCDASLQFDPHQGKLSRIGLQYILQNGGPHVSNRSTSAEMPALRNNSDTA